MDTTTVQAIQTLLNGLTGPAKEGFAALVYYTRVDAILGIIFMSGLLAFAIYLWRMGRRVEVTSDDEGAKKVCLYTAASFLAFLAVALGFCDIRALIAPEGTVILSLLHGH